MEQMTEYNSKMKMSQWMRTIPQGVTAEVGCSTFRDYHNKKNVAYYTGRTTFTSSRPSFIVPPITALAA